MNKIEIEKDLYSVYKFGLYNKYNIFDEENKFLANLVIPFANSIDPISDFRIAYLKILQILYKIPSGKLVGYRSDILDFSTDVLDFVVSAQSLLRQMFDVALNRSNLDEIGFKKLEEKIDKAIYYKKLYWRGGEFTGYKVTGNEFIKIDSVCEVPKLTLSSAKDMFHIIVEELADAVAPGTDKFNGFSAIGVCNYCACLYEKSRSNQCYCSESCSNRAKQMRYNVRILKQKRIAEIVTNKIE